MFEADYVMLSLSFDICRNLCTGKTFLLASLRGCEADTMSDQNSTEGILQVPTFDFKLYTTETQSIA